LLEREQSPANAMNAYKLLGYVRPIELAQLLKRVLKPGRVLVESNGCRFLVDPLSNFGGRLISFGEYEQSTTRWLSEVLREGDTFVDIGANEGWYSLIAASLVRSAGSVIAVEPQERCWPAIHRNFLLNGFFNYRVIPYAVGDMEGEIEMVLYPSLNNEASTLVARRRTRFMKRQNTRVTTLERIVKSLKLDVIRLLKIDCEGYELKVLIGAERLLESGSIAHLLIEIHPRELGEMGRHESEVTDYLRSLRFHPVGANDQTFWTHHSALRGK
jgi:FkbM family methyltransferase